MCGFLTSRSRYTTIYLQVSIPGVDENGDFLQNARNQTMERLHPVASKEEVPIDVEVARIVAVHLSAQSFHHVLLVEVFLNPVQLVVAQAVARALLPDVVGVLSAALIRPKDAIVAVNRSRHTGPDALAVVARLDEALATRKSVIHAIAGLLVEHMAAQQSKDR